MKKRIILVIIVIILLAASAYMILDYFKKVHEASEARMEAQKQAQMPVEKEITIKIYFGNKNMAPSQTDCRAVFPVDRIIPNDLIIRRRAIEEILAGPTQTEIEQGYFSSFPSKEEIVAFREKAMVESGEAPYEGDEIKIKSVKILAGTAYIVFSKELKAVLVDSCRMEMIKTSLRESVKQFPKVGGVIIYIEGEEGQRI